MPPEPLERRFSAQPYVPNFVPVRDARFPDPYNMGVNAEVFLHDPVADPDEAKHEYGVTLMSWEELPQADAIVLAVAHNEYTQMDHKKLLAKAIPGGSFIDVKSKFDRAALEADGFRVWRL